MNDYYKVDITFTPYSEIESDIMCAFLGEAGYESFVTNEPTLSAYIKKELYDEQTLTNVKSLYDFTSELNFYTELIIGEDWNAEWEKHYFKPLVIANDCVIHSTFHKDYPKCKYDITIDPKMAFGTGHHETTTLMITQLLLSEMKGKYILDMGTGTGILAILSSMLGAKRVKGVEIDPPAQVNAMENVALNGIDNVDIILGDASSIESDKECYDLVLANINRNIILADIAHYSAALRPKGYMQLSGFYEQDIPVLMESASKYGLSEVRHEVLNHWTMLLLKKD